MIKISQSELNKSYVVFQLNAYKGIELFRYSSEFINKWDRMELFPGIFFHKTEISGVKKLFYHLLKRDTIFYQIEVCNKRDRFEIMPTITNIHTNNEGKTIIANIDINKVEYPNNLGGGECGGCPVLRKFDSIAINHGYHIISDSVILSEISGIKFFNELCKNSRCHKTYLKIKNEGFDKGLPKNKMIYITEYRNKMIASEGKHRICALKRYKYQGDVNAIIYQVNKEYDNSISEVSYSPRLYLIYDYYKKFEDFGINKEEVRNYLMNENIKLSLLIAQKQGWIG